ncbi:hypothetical protein ACH4T9_17815 [Micromonospora sp. NPDC020750]
MRKRFPALRRWRTRVPVALAVEAVAVVLTVELVARGRLRPKPA